MIHLVVPMYAWAKVLLIVTVILLGITSIMSHRGIDSFPMLADEYTHLSLAQQLIEEGELPFVNPHLAIETPHFNLQSGFHFLLAGIFLFVGGEPLFYYAHFALLFFVINSLLLFYLVKLWTEDFLAAITSVFFFGTITSTHALLAHEFFIPLSVGTSLLLAAFMLFHKWTSTPKPHLMLWLGVVLLIAAGTYPPSLIFFLFVVFVYLCSLDHALPESLNMRRGTFFLFIIITTVILAVISLFALHSLSLLDMIFFGAAWDIMHLRASPVFYFGIIPSSLAFVGLLSVMRSTEKHSRLVMYWFVSALAAIFAFYLLDVSVLLPFPRLFFFYLMSVAVLAGIGVSFLVRQAMCFTKGYLYGTTVALSMLVLCGIHYQNTLAHTSEYPTILTEGSYRALVALQDMPRGIVIADSNVSQAIYPVTGNHVVGLLSSNISGGDPGAALVFLTGSCEEKAKQYEELRPYTNRLKREAPPLYVLSSTPQECSYLHELYGSGYFLYEVMEDALLQYHLHLYEDRLTPPDTITLPSTPVLRGEEIFSLLADTTLRSSEWVEHYTPEGRFWGGEGTQYAGYWQVHDSVFCYYYPNADYSSCTSVSVRGNTATFYNLSGAPESSAVIVRTDHH